jgi:hypothetical protein
MYLIVITTFFWNQQCWQWQYVRTQESQWPPGTGRPGQPDHCQWCQWSDGLQSRVTGPLAAVTVTGRHGHSGPNLISSFLTYSTPFITGTEGQKHAAARIWVLEISILNAALLSHAVHEQSHWLTIWTLTVSAIHKFSGISTISSCHCHNLSTTLQVSSSVSTFSDWLKLNTFEHSRFTQFHWHWQRQDFGKLSWAWIWDNAAFPFACCAWTQYK